MKLKTIEIKNKVIARVFLCPDLKKDIKSSDVGYAGFKTKGGLRQYLLKMDSVPVEGKIERHWTLNTEKISSLIKEAVMLCYKLLPNNQLKIFVFPTSSEFVNKKMSGTTGYTPWINTMLVFINILNHRWEKSLIETVCHEFNHSVFFKHNKCESLLDSMIFEGLAEHFREQTAGGKQAPWTTALNQNQSRGLLLEMESEGFLRSTDPKIYHAVFFGSKKYAMWSGYSIGYHIVDLFLRNNPDLKWKEIMAKQPKDIFEKSNFINKKPRTA